MHAANWRRPVFWTPKTTTPRGRAMTITHPALDAAADRLVALLAAIEAAAADIHPAGDDTDGVTLELLYGVLRARAAIRDALDRVGRASA